jgi:hypothetical protein
MACESGSGTTKADRRGAWIDAGWRRSDHVPEGKPRGGATDDAEDTRTLLNKPLNSKAPRFARGGAAGSCVLVADALFVESPPA